MPEAAWCSACQKYVWVSPQGACQFGHGPEFLSGRYVEMTPAELGGDASSSQGAPAAEADPDALTHVFTHHMWRRFAAFVIDYVLAAVPVFAWTFLVTLAHRVLAQAAQEPAWLKALLLVGGVIVFYAYFIVSEGLFSTTLGKRLLGLRVINASTGGKVSWRQSATRNALLFVDLLFWGVVGIVVANNNPWRQRFGDKKAATVVIKGTGNVDYLPLPDLATRRALRGWQGITLIVVVVALLGGAFAAATRESLAPASIPATESNADALTQGEQASGATVSADDAVDAEEPIPQSAGVKTPNSKPMTAKQWNAFIAEQYPGYHIEQRINVPAPWNEELDDMHYVLVSKSRPRFTLLVNLAQLTADRSIGQVPESYHEVTDSVASDDALFSADVARHTTHLRDRGQVAIIDGYLAKKPDSTAVAYGGFGDESTFDFMVATGSKAVARVIKDHNDANYLAEGKAPSGPRHGNVSVTVSPW